jgi:SH3 domain protein
MAREPTVTLSLFALVPALLLGSGAIRAQTAYVTDELVITLRTGPSTQNSIVENLRSGDAVEILEQDEELGYARVRAVESGDEGWVLSRYLETERTAALRLAAAERELAEARVRIAELETELAAHTDDLTQAQAALEASQTNNLQLSNELGDIRDASANAISLQDQNESLRRKNNVLTQEVEQLGMLNSTLASRSRQNWFIVGAIVLAGGILIGLVAPSLRRRRRSNW